MTWNPHYILTQTMLTDLTKIETVKQSFEEKPLSVSLLASLHQSAKAASVHFSTKIEGNRLSLKQVETMLYTTHKSVKGKQGHDEKEVNAYYEALTYLEQCLDQGVPLTEKLIAQVHARVEGHKKIKNYREGQNAIYNSANGSLVYLPPEAQDVPLLMKELVLWVNKNETILPVPLIAGVFHYQFVTIHPYFDGNGRTARLLTSYLMCKLGYGLKGIYSLEEYYANDLNGYYKVLETHPHHNYYFGRAQADMTSWLEYFIRGTREVFESITQKAQQLSHQTVLDEHALLLRQLDAKQRRVLELFVQYREITSVQMGQYLGVSSQVARLQLNKWVQTGFLQIVNPSKKRRTYGLAEKFEKLLCSD